ncbi:MAG: DUF2029 domain-containing protein [Myxococcaceae bacterium]|nr:DUF2029 domain-containing protein [Myxococcaceae bacterium]
MIPDGSTAPALSSFSPAERRARWIAALTALALVALAIALGANPRRGIDLRVYLTAASRFLDGSPLYRASDGAMPFKYAPPGAWLFIPLLALPARGATVLWNLLSVATLLASARWWSRRLGLGEKGAACVGLTVLALAHPIFFELHYAQVDLAMLGLFTAATDGLERRRPVQAGIASPWRLC